MDLVTHAIVGGFTGALWGHPFIGAAVAAAPDVVLGLRRRALPSTLYNVTHCVAFAACAALAFNSQLVLWCLLSHLALDLPTHGPQWAPPLLYPYSNRRFSWGSEWEFFNDAWWFGLGFSIIWCLVCVFLQSS